MAEPLKLMFQPLKIVPHPNDKIIIEYASLSIANMSPALNFYLHWYWAVGSRCFTDLTLVVLTCPSLLAVLFIICSIAPLLYLTHHLPLSIILAQNSPMHGIVSRVWRGWQW